MTNDGSWARVSAKETEVDRVRIRWGRHDLLIDCRGWEKKDPPGLGMDGGNTNWDEFLLKWKDDGNI